MSDKGFVGGQPLVDRQGLPPYAGKDIGVFVPQNESKFVDLLERRHTEAAAGLCVALYLVSRQCGIRTVTEVVNFVHSGVTREAVDGH
jgi:hypothetical protein